MPVVLALLPPAAVFPPSRCWNGRLRLLLLLLLPGPKGPPVKEARARCPTTEDAGAVAGGRGCVCECIGACVCD